MAEASTRVVVVGAGHAGVQVADALRSRGFDGDVVLIDEQDALPYQRPPLSKEYLAAGEATPLPLRAERFFAERRIDLRRGVVVAEVDRSARLVRLSDGTHLHYDALVLATGAAARRLDVPGTTLSGVHELRTLADAARVQPELARARSVLVVGAGFIGLEFAAAARARGLEVTVWEAGERPLGRCLTPAMAGLLAAAHREMGTELRCGEGLAELVGDDGVVRRAVGTSDVSFDVDLVLLGVGVTPRDDLARAAGLPVDDGVLVDPMLRTSDPRVLAVGDCARVVDAHGEGLRLESVQNATDQADHAASTILGGAADYAAVPWFWSTQGSLRLQIAGLARPDDDTVLLGDPESGRFSVVCLRDGRLVAVESVNRPADHVAARRILGGADRPSAQDLAAPHFTLKQYALRSTDPLVTTS